MRLIGQQSTGWGVALLSKGDAPSAFLVALPALPYSCDVECQLRRHKGSDGSETIGAYLVTDNQQSLLAEQSTSASGAAGSDGESRPRQSSCSFWRKGADIKLTMADNKNDVAREVLLSPTRR